MAGNGLKTADPSADGDKDDEIGVLDVFECALGFVLGGLEFFLERIPLFMLGEVDEFCPARLNLVLHAEGAGELHDVAPDIVDSGGILGLHGNITVRDESAEVEGHLWPAA